ncbi:preprotein translocase subunit YajC [Corynebacterium nasicanis]|uniref:Preprotein translocase subunit YajC n=1 Tax=Corynebacterium nasicanis TaxID=1448267 RepID=A0ABW1Q7I2_9CORY
MDILLLVLIVAVFILPSFLMMRSQRRRQGEMQAMQSSLGVGDRVVTVAGIHGTIVGARETQVEVEIAPGVQVTMDRIAIMRQATPEDLGVVPVVDEQIGYQHPEQPEHPEHPQHPEHPEHPENR